MKKAVIPGLVAASLALLLSCAGTPTTVESQIRDWDEFRSQARALIERRSREPGIVGLSVAVVYTGASSGEREILVDGFGWADKVAGKRAGRESIFRVGSVSKTATALAAMRLSEEGAFDIDAPIQAVLPTFSIKDFRYPDSAPVTARGIMTHHSGLPSDIMLDFESDRPFTDIVPLFASSYRSYPADYILSYSNAGFSLLGTAVEAAAGEPFAVYMEKSVFEPLGMERAGFLLRDDMLPFMVKSYDEAGNEAADMRIRDTPAGALWLSAGDAARYLRFWLGKGELDGTRLLSPSTVEEMTRVQNAGVELDFGQEIGLAWFIKKERYGTVIVHGGDTKLFHACTLFVPELGVGVHVAGNSQACSSVVSSLATELARMAAEAASGRRFPPPPSVPSSDPVPAEDPKDYGPVAGLYQFPSLGAVNIDAIPGGLKARIQGMDVVLRPDAQGRFWPRLSFLFLELKIPEFEGIFMELKVLDGKETIIFHAQGSVLIGLKQAPKRVSSDWLAWCGIYQGPDGPIQKLGMAYENGFLFMNIDSQSGSQRYVLSPVDGDKAVMEGIGRGMNEVIEASSRGSETVLVYSGLEFWRSK